MLNLVWAGVAAIIAITSGAAVSEMPGPTECSFIMEPPPQQLITRPVPGPFTVVHQILSFDATGDNRIARYELPERMQGLVSRGDKNQDGFLTSDEVVALVATPPAERDPMFSQPAEHERTTFAVRDPGSIADVVADLKLP